jgi:hypothetical protein
MRFAVLITGALLLAACSGDGRPEQGASFFDPACMPDGSVVYYQYANQNGSFDAAQGSKANCPWNKGKATR